MTREEQRREASIDYQLSTDPRAIGGDAFADIAREMNVNPSFIAGAKWADKTMIEKAINWLQSHANDFMPASYSIQKYNTNLLLYYFKKTMEE